MIVNRMVFNFKPGKVMEAVELVKAGGDYGLPEPPHGLRIYWPNISSYDQVVIEVEFENLAEHEEYWRTWWSSPRSEEWVEKWMELREAGSGEEIWNLEAMR